MEFFCKSIDESLSKLVIAKEFVNSLVTVIFARKSKNHSMLIIDARESESLDKALKKYKKKFEKAGVLKQLRSRQSFTKPSVERRGQVLRAVYREKMAREEEA